MFDSVMEHMRWIFSGVGVVFFSCIITLILTRRRKKRKIAKQLGYIYLSIDEILERANEILLLLATDNDGITDESLLDLAEEQIRNLEEIRGLIQREDLIQFLKIYKPGSVTRLQWLIDKKLVSLNKAIPSSLRDTSPQMKLLSLTLLSISRRLASLGDGLKNRRKRRKAGTVFDEAKDIQEAKEILAQIAQLGEELRIFLVESFEIEDIA